jgi:hypothetical protein
VGRLGDFFAEWKARRAGSKYVSKDIQKSARHVIGPTGNGFSNAWDTMAESSDAYIESFDPRIPPSLFISQRDKTRLNQPIPLIERRLEAYNDDAGDDLTADELDWGSQPPGA